MGTVTTLPRGGGFTRKDLEAMPDDGRRYELIDGALIVTPAPSRLHQRASLRLAVMLHAHCPEDLEVLTAPFDVILDGDSVLQPDLLVGRRSDVTDRDLPAAPLLAVEIESPSSRRIDLHLKRARFEAAGCTSYWVVDPDQPSITVWELQESRYVVTARAQGDEEVTVGEPFEVTIRPSDLVR